MWAWVLSCQCLSGCSQQQVFLGLFSTWTAKATPQETDVLFAFLFLLLFLTIIQKHHTCWEKTASLLWNIPLLERCTREILTSICDTVTGMGLTPLTLNNHDTGQDIWGTAFRLWIKTVQGCHPFDDICFRNAIISKMMSECYNHTGSHLGTISYHRTK